MMPKKGAKELRDSIVEWVHLYPERAEAGCGCSKAFLKCSETLASFGWVISQGYVSDV
ncbi:hypothetical protein N9K70_03165 [Pseudomonadales bacterium]|nr:hypothetical protein [Pseudomonadales bacterium]